MPIVDLLNGDPLAPFVDYPATNNSTVGDDSGAVYTPILVVTMPEPYVGYGSTIRSRSGADPRSSTIRDRDFEHEEV